MNFNNRSGDSESVNKKINLLYSSMKNIKTNYSHKKENKNNTQCSFKDLSLTEYKIKPIYASHDKTKMKNNYKNINTSNISTKYYDHKQYYSLVFFAKDKDRIKFKNNNSLEKTKNEFLRTQNNEASLPQLSNNFVDDAFKKRVINSEKKVKNEYKFNNKSNNINKSIILKNFNQNFVFKNKLKNKNKTENNNSNSKNNSLPNKNSFSKSNINTSSFRKKKFKKVKNLNNEYLRKIVSKEYETVKTLLEPKYKSRQKKYNNNLLDPIPNCKEIFDLKDSKGIHKFLVNEEINRINECYKEPNYTELKNMPKKNFNTYLYLSSKNPYEEIVNFDSKGLLLNNEKFLKELYEKES